jgi:lipopolysaccharide/colanic/teichoic acid biosynthesis glycosyltransferase
VKRFFDVTMAVLLLVLTAPLLAATAIVVLLDTGSPVLFRQARVGHHGRIFIILKFRTMTSSVGPHITVGRDPRVTWSGRWLRSWKLDELPQLVNVLRGDMSLVGWRPELPEYVVRYPDLFAPLLAYRPGVVDPAALRFRHESDLLARQSDPERYYVEVLLPAKVELSLQYARAASLRTDLLVLRGLVA